MQTNTNQLDAKAKRLYVIFFMLLVLASGTAFSVVQKWQNKTPGYNGVNFDHPYFQTFVGSIGETLALLVYYIKQRNAQTRARTLIPIEKEETYKEAVQFDDTSTLMSGSRMEPVNEEPKQIDKKLFAIPAWLDMIESVLKNVATTMIA